MSTRNLESFFQPQSIAVIGASEHDHSLGGVVLKNLLQGKFEGKLFAVNSKGYPEVHGIPCFRKISALPSIPDLAILCTRPTSIPRLVRLLGRQGVRAALIIMGGLSGTRTWTGRPLKESALAAAKPYGIRLLGPNVLGVMVPGHKLNASYSHLNVAPGDIAFVGESAILGAANIDWVHGHGIGFSHFLTLGDSVDVDMADVVDYLVGERNTKAILLHIEHPPSARRFISAVRAAARGKLVIAIKSNRTAHTQDLATPGITGRDVVFDAVFRRAGVLRVGSSDEFTDVLETLTRMKPLRGERLAIISNGMGPGTLATDALIGSQCKLAELDSETIKALETILPPFWDQRNPIDINADASPHRYAAVLDIVTRDPGVDAVLVLHVPTLRATSLAVAEAIIEKVKGCTLNVLTCWLGHASVQEARQAFRQAVIPTYLTPEKAVQAFVYMMEHRCSQAILRQTPPAFPYSSREELSQAKELADKTRRRGRDYLTGEEARQMLAVAGIPVRETRYAATVDEAVAQFETVGGPIALQIMHEIHRYPFADESLRGERWRGVAWDLESADEVARAAHKLEVWAHQNFPQSKILGFAQQQMCRGLNSLLLHLGVTRDAVFGPLIVFGIDGPKVMRRTDRRIALPPLNMNLARDLITGSQVYALLQSHSKHAQHHLEVLCRTLVQLSQLVIAAPRIRGLEIHPLLLNRDGVSALDVTVDLDEEAPLAIAPYPDELCEEIALPKSRRHVKIRPIRAEDEPAHLAFHQRLSPQALRYRFFHVRRDLTHDELAQMTQIDYDREMVFIATAPLDGDGSETLAEVRAWIDADKVEAELSIVVRDDYRGEGLGYTLMHKVIDFCRHQGVLEVGGTVLPENEPMLQLADRLGFIRRYDPVERVIDIRLTLNPPVEDWQKQRLARRYPDPIDQSDFSPW